MKRIKRTAIVLALLLALILISFIGCEPKNKEGDDLVFKGPVEIGMKVGERLPGTDVEVISVSDDTANIRTDGEVAHKKAGDSLEWSGSLTEDVDVDLSLRILWISEGTVQTAGTAKLSVRGADPEGMPVQSESDIRYALPVTYSVRQGERIPGTLIEYVGKDPEKGAEFAGIKGYPFRKAADSLVWEGRLRDGVWLKLDLRVLLFSDTTLQAGGVATIWVEH